MDEQWMADEEAWFREGGDEEEDDNRVIEETEEGWWWWWEMEEGVVALEGKEKEAEH
jgi:hypothetical protein